MYFYLYMHVYLLLYIYIYKCMINKYIDNIIALCMYKCSKCGIYKDNSHLSMGILEQSVHFPLRTKQWGNHIQGCWAFVPHHVHLWECEGRNGAKHRCKWKEASTCHSNCWEGCQWKWLPFRTWTDDVFSTIIGVIIIIIIVVVIVTITKYMYEFAHVVQPPWYIYIYTKASVYIYIYLI